MVERQLPKLYVEGSIPFSRSRMFRSHSKYCVQITANCQHKTSGRSGFESNGLEKRTDTEGLIHANRSCSAACKSRIGIRFSLDFRLRPVCSCLGGGDVERERSGGFYRACFRSDCLVFLKTLFLKTWFLKTLFWPRMRSEICPRLFKSASFS